jgi:hypothetical protein
MKKYKIAVLDDYQNGALEGADWSLLRERADIAVFQNHLADPVGVIERLLPFDVVCVMRERTPLPRNVIERLPNSQAHCLDGTSKRLDRCRRRGRSRDRRGSHGVLVGPHDRIHLGADLGTSDEVAKVAVFLASDDSSYVTGTELFVDGGVAQI